MRHSCIWLTSLLLATSILAQNPSPAGSTSASSSSAAGSPGAGAGGSGTSSGSITLENEIMAYDAIEKIAGVIGKQISGGSSVLIATATNLSEVAAFMTFDANAAKLATAYESKKPVVSHSDAFGQEEMFASGAFGGADLGPSVTAIATLLSALKASTSTTSSTFTPVDEALIADIESHSENVRVVSVPFPKDMQTGGDAIATSLASVYSARADAVKALVGAPHPKGKEPYDPSSDLKDLDTQLTALQSSLAASSSSSSSDVLMGAGLLSSVGAIRSLGGALGTTLVGDAKYRILVFSNDVAGGGVRTNQTFLVSFFLPLPHPSYNGGAVVSFSLRDQGGALIEAHTYHYMFGYSRIKGPKSGKADYSNLPSDGSEATTKSGPKTK